jgi:hypothetical protein
VAKHTRKRAGIRGDTMQSQLDSMETTEREAQIQLTATVERIWGYVRLNVDQLDAGIVCLRIEAMVKEAVAAEVAATAAVRTELRRVQTVLANLKKERACE